jgi:hypothetical protein
MNTGYLQLQHFTFSVTRYFLAQYNQSVQIRPIRVIRVLFLQASDTLNRISGRLTIVDWRLKSKS